LDVYSTPGIAIGNEDGLAMQEAGKDLWRTIDQKPALAQALAQSVGLDIDLFFSLTQFVGKRQFSVQKSDSHDGKKGPTIALSPPPIDRPTRPSCDGECDPGGGQQQTP
jgi:hypothetical protein